MKVDAKSLRYNASREPRPASMEASRPQVRDDRNNDAQSLSPRSSEIRHLATAVRLLIVALFIFSVANPAFVTLLGQVLWSDNAQGSIVELNGESVGAELIGQQFASDTYFHPRPSSKGYDAMDSGSQNLGPLSVTLTERVQERLAELQTQGIDPSRVPASWVTESGSALDPHITPEAARLQIPRVSRATDLSPATLEELIEKHTEGKFMGLFGLERVNVLLLNLDIQIRLGESQ